jgi:hypothetical protein
MRRLIAVMLLVLVPELVSAQDAKRPRPERSSEPNYGTAPGPGTGPGGQEIRPGSPDGDAPSASAGQIAREPVQRIFGLPVTTVLVIAAVILGLLAIAGFVIPNTRRRARGDGTYGQR